MPKHVLRLLWRVVAASLLIAAFGALAACGDDEKKDGAAETERAAEPTERGAADVTLDIVAPDDGDTVTSPVTLEVASTGVEIAPAADAVEDAAHYHAFVDQDEIPAEGGTVPQETEGIYHFATDSQEIELEPGEHIVVVALGDNSHAILEVAEHATVSFTVE